MSIMAAGQTKLTFSPPDAWWLHLLVSVPRIEGEHCDQCQRWSAHQQDLLEKINLYLSLIAMEAYDAKGTRAVDIYHQLSLDEA
jgi:hypothetical protein